MDRLHRAIKDVHRLDDLAARDTWLNRLAPLPKLLAAVVYLAVTLSFGRYQLTGVLGMGLWPLLLLELADFTPGDALRAFKPVAVLLTVVGLCNLPFDRAVLLHAGPLSVTGGILSLGVLLAKGLFCFLAVWVLIASTGMESVCGLTAIALSAGAHHHNFTDIPLHCAVFAGGYPHCHRLCAARTRAKGRPVPGVGLTAGAAATAQHRPRPAGVREHAAAGLCRIFSARAEKARRLAVFGSNGFLLRRFPRRAGV